MCIRDRHYQRLRRLYAPFVQRYVALSQDLQAYLTGRVGLAPQRIEQIYNGVDAHRFSPAAEGPVPIPGAPFAAPAHWLVGTVGRMQTVKHQTLLARAFVLALQQQPALRQRLRLVLVGDGPLRAQAQSVLAEGGVADLAWLPGERADVPAVMRGLNSQGFDRGLSGGGAGLLHGVELRFGRHTAAALTQLGQAGVEV